MKGKCTLQESEMDDNCSLNQSSREGLCDSQLRQSGKAIYISCLRQNNLSLGNIWVSNISSE